MILRAHKMGKMKRSLFFLVLTLTNITSLTISCGESKPSEILSKPGEILISQQIDTIVAKHPNSYHRMLRDSTMAIHDLFIRDDWQTVEGKLHAAGYKLIQRNDSQYLIEYRYLLKEAAFSTQSGITMDLIAVIETDARKEINP